MISPGFNVKIPKIFETTTQINVEKTFIVIPSNSLYILDHEPVDPQTTTSWNPKAIQALEDECPSQTHVTCFSFQPGIFRKKKQTQHC